jgi:hypothetical protein
MVMPLETSNSVFLYVDMINSKHSFHVAVSDGFANDLTVILFLVHLPTRLTEIPTAGRNSPQLDTVVCGKPHLPVRRTDGVIGLSKKDTLVEKQR